MVERLMTENEYLTDKDLQEFLKVSRWTTWRLRREGQIPFQVLPGGGIRYSKVEIFRWLGRLRQAEELGCSENRAG